MRTADHRLILQYMRQNVSDALDHKTNEVNATLLAEDACTSFNDFFPDYDIPEIYFELAEKVATSYESALAGKTKWRE